MPIDQPPAIICEAPRAIDGDTIRCANLPTSVRLIGIDAPELPGHCRKGRICTPGDGFAAQRTLAALMRGTVLVLPSPSHDRYGRILARLVVAGVDLNCAMIGAGQAARRYSVLVC